MQKSLIQNIFSILISLAVIGGSFFAGTYIGERRIPDIVKVTELLNKADGQPETVDFSPFWKTWNLINEKYVGNDDVADSDKVWGAIQGLATSLGDPYTVFLPPDDAEVFESTISGNFGGVGMEIGLQNGVLTVIAPLKDTPAYKAGIRSGDAIIQVDDTATADITIEQAVQMIRGELGTTVTLKLFREGEDGLFDVDIVRENIVIPTLEATLRDDGIFLIQLYNFSAPSPHAFRGALRDFVESGTDKLIIDVRGNPGGFLNAAIDITSWFLPAGKVVVRESFGGKTDEKIHRSRGYDVFTDQLKLVVLVNEGSASASEMLAGALNGHNIATVVGTRTFGKGSVQELISVTGGTSLKVTVAEWLTPNGTSISDGGLQPDVEVVFSQEDFKAGKDPQLEKAVDIVLSQD